METKFQVSILWVFFATTCYAQNEQYAAFVKKAEQFFAEKAYKQAGQEYSNAFWTNGGKGIQTDRYKAAIAWTLAAVNDSAFFNLNRLLRKGDVLEYKNLVKEKEFEKLHSDTRWHELLTALNPNNEIYNDSLATVLVKMSEEDQKYRTSHESFQLHHNEIQRIDSLNFVKIEQLLAKYGWLSANVVGYEGNMTIWLIIQHSPFPVMEKYLPIMEKAVQEGKATKKHLAYLQDRVLMNQGKPQLYGTQSQSAISGGEMKLWKIEDPENLNKRRESVGLPPMKIEY